MKNTTILLLLCRPLSDNRMFCTFEEVWGPAAAEKRHWEQLLWERKELDVSDISLQIEKHVLIVICPSFISENSLTACSYTKGLLLWYFGTFVKFCSGKSVCWVATLKLNTVLCELFSVLLHPITHIRIIVLNKGLIFVWYVLHICNHSCISPV